MKTRQILLIIQVFLVFLVVVAVAVAVRLWPRTIAFEDCSEVYQRYAGVEGVEASFIKGFPLNDTVAVDVTLLKAQNSAIWTDLIISLCHQESYDDFFPGDLFFYPVPKQSITQSIEKELNNEYIIVSNRKDLTVGVFHLECIQQQEIIINNYINSLINNKEEQ